MRWCMTLKEMDYGGEWFVKNVYGPYPSCATAEVYGQHYVKILRQIHKYKDNVYDYDVYELEEYMKENVSGN